MREIKLPRKIPKKSEINGVLTSFSKKEWAIFGLFLLAFAVSGLLILNKVNKSFMTTVPLRGGEVREGILGSPRFVNPALAYSDTDRDLVALIYSGLIRKDPEGALVPDLAVSYEVSKDGMTYTFVLKDDLAFHDGRALTADDVIFTIEKIKDPIIKSPRKASFEGVTVEKVDAGTVRFALKQPYASFLENMTLGIMPKHVWENSPLELNESNTDPVGSGPYMIKSIEKESSGIIRSYILSANKKFALGAPYVESLMLHFYPNEGEMVKALEGGTVDQISSITPALADGLKEEGYRIESSVLPRIFGLFFNQNQNQIFTNKKVVKAISDAIDKERIIDSVLSGYGTSIDSPIPKAGTGEKTKNNNSREEIIKKIQEDLAKDGWKAGTSGFLEKTATVNKKKTSTILGFSISTGNAPELSKSAELIKEDLAKVGINVEIKTFDVGNLNQTVIRPRKYDALLFGEIINNESDLYAFWHSSQRKDPGLNVAIYTSAKADQMLEDAFITLDPEARAKKYVQFESEIKKDMPAIFLYSPNFIYVVKKDLEGLMLRGITSPSDRFLAAHKWYTQNDNVWKIFAR